MKKKTKISSEKLRLLTKSARRKSQIESGIGVKPATQVHKSAKDYSRKIKHKKSEY